MIAPLARGDFEDLQAQGLNPTLEDFDRLNQIALRLTEGAETTSANFPRVAWAGDIPFFEPTIQAFIWYHEYASRTAANVDTEDTLEDTALPYPLLLIVGGEKRGISHAVRRHADTVVKISYGRDFDAALSAASATTILAYEIAKQNRK